MNRVLFSIVILVLLGGVAWLRRAERAGSSRVPERTFEEAAPLPASSPLPSSALSTFRALPAPSVPAAPAPRSPSVGPPRPEGNVIAYEVIDDFAVAYGDLIIGRPIAGQTPARGHFEAPTPQLWERPEIPFVIAPDLPNPARVEQALAYFRARTPVNFVPYSGAGDGIVFTKGEKHCFSSLGRMGGLQAIHLSAGCQVSEIIHEIMHALGFVHEQSRPDRDAYLEVLWDHIDPLYQNQFNVVPESFMAALRDAPFDHRSAMLYRAETFARSPELPTMRAKSEAKIDPVPTGLSEEDIRRLNRLYRFHE